MTEPNKPVNLPLELFFSSESVEPEPIVSIPISEETQRKVSENIRKTFNMTDEEKEQLHKDAMKVQCAKNKTYINGKLVSREEFNKTINDTIAERGWIGGGF